MTATSIASESPRHHAIKEEIRHTCEQLGVGATAEAAGKGWKADVLVATESLPIAFEVQTSPHTLKRTIERQERYLRHQVAGCWLFLRPVKGLNDERPDLPLFYVSEDEQGEFLVSLGGRRDVKLRQFIAEYLQGKVRFCPDAVSSREQGIQLAFYEMRCWKCGRNPDSR
jgi:competence CoiA-like predicted nuclease